MNLEEIISAAVEQKIAKVVNEMVNARPTWDYPPEWRPTQLESTVGKMIEEIARDEVKKYEGTVRRVIQEALTTSPARFEISAYSKIEFPK